MLASLAVIAAFATPVEAADFKVGDYEVVLASRFDKVIDRTMIEKAMPDAKVLMHAEQKANKSGLRSLSKAYIAIPKGQGLKLSRIVGNDTKLSYAKEGRLPVGVAVKMNDFWYRLDVRVETAVLLRAFPPTGKANRAHALALEPMRLLRHNLGHARVRVQDSHTSYTPGQILDSRTLQAAKLTMPDQHRFAKVASLRSKGRLLPSGAMPARQSPRAPAIAPRAENYDVVAIRRYIGVGKKPLPLDVVKSALPGARVLMRAIEPANWDGQAPIDLLYVAVPKNETKKAQESLRNAGLGSVDVLGGEKGRVTFGIELKGKRGKQRGLVEVDKNVVLNAFDLRKDFAPRGGKALDAATLMALETSRVSIIDSDGKKRAPVLRSNKLTMPKRGAELRAVFFSRVPLPRLFRR